MMIPQEPSFFGTTPRGEHCRVGRGREGKGPAVWPLLISLWRASVTASGWRRVDFRFGVILW